MHTRVRDSVRNGSNRCASTLSVDEIYGPRKEELFKCAEGKVQEEFDARGLLITRLTLDSEVRLPKQVQEAMEASTAATQNAQRVEREVASAEAEGKKLVATARAAAEARLTQASVRAEANRVIAAAITPELLKLRQLEIEQQKAQKWDGKLPVVSGGEGTSMILDVGPDRRHRGEVNVATANLALLLLVLLGSGLLLGVGGAVPRLGRWFAGWQTERRIGRERLRQEQLKTALLEEQLRNEVLRDIGREAPRSPAPEERP